MDIETAARDAARLIKAASYGVALTGAGISVPSGIPDFRSANIGLWSTTNPMEVASLSAFHLSPEKFYDWFRPLANHIWKAQPNPAHTSLAQLEINGFINTVVTQNIDGLHQRAGSSEVIEVHGSIENLLCLQCRDNFSSTEFMEPYIHQKSFPTCPRCDAILKPNFVFFEEMLPDDAWQEAQTHFEKADLVLVVGSSLEVTPAAHLPLYSLENDARIIIITYSPTYLDTRAELVLPFDVAEIFPKILALL